MQLGLCTAQLLAQPDGLGLSLAQGCGHALEFRLWKGDNEAGQGSSTRWALLMPLSQVLAVCMVGSQCHGQGLTAVPGSDTVPTQRPSIRGFQGRGISAPCAYGEIAQLCSTLIQRESHSHVTKVDGQ